ncbi:MAG: hypothetical protein D3904_05490, partial [Candidatus Electrothrix sp. EH2]|nr:hypothetical protein [Candidatus Electrothrix sp. EH2]
DLVTKLADKRLIVTGRDEERGEETVEVVHEALIRRWQTLRQWVDEEREFLVWQEKLRVLLGQWEESGKDEGALLRGLPLDEALQWKETHELHLAEKEQEIIKESLSVRRKQRRRKIFTVTFGVLLAAAVMVMFFSLWNITKTLKIFVDVKEYEARKERYEAEQQTLTANYNLAKTFEEKALAALRNAQEDHSNQTYQQVVLFASAALEQEIEMDKYALDASSIGSFFALELFDIALAEQWSSPAQGHMNAYGEFAHIGFSFKGRYLLALSSDKHSFPFWDIEHGGEKKVISVFNTVDQLFDFVPDFCRTVFNYNGEKFASISWDGTIRLWNTASGKELASLKKEITCHSIRLLLSPDGTTLVYTTDSDIRILNFTNQKEIVIPKEGSVEKFIVSPDGTCLASIFLDNTIRLWDIENGQELGVINKTDSASINSVAFSPDGRRLAFTSQDDTVRIRDIESGRELSVFNHTFSVNSIAFTPDGTLLAFASLIENTIRVWDIEREKEIFVFEGHSDSINSIFFNPDGTRLASISLDNTIRLWGIDTKREINILKGHTDSVKSVTFSPDGTLLASASSDNTIRLWRIDTKREINILKGHTDSINNVTFSPDGTHLASASSDNTIRLWKQESKKEVFVLKGHTDKINSVTFTPDGMTLASVSEDFTVRLWDTESGKEKKRIRYQYIGVGLNSSSFTHDFKQLAFADEGYDDIFLTDIKTEEITSIFDTDDRHSVVELSISPDDNLLVSSSRAGVYIWDMKTTKKLSSLRGGDENFPTSLNFSDDGKWLVSGHGDATVRLWDISKRKELAVFTGHQKIVNSVTFSPDGTIIASASDDKTVRIWNLRPYLLFLQNFEKPTPLYHTFIDAVKFLWQLDVQGLEIVETKRRTPADLEKYGTLLAPPPPGQSKFDQVLEWAEKQQEK